MEIAGCIQARGQVSRAGRFRSILNRLDSLALKDPPLFRLVASYLWPHDISNTKFESAL